MTLHSLAQKSIAAAAFGLGLAALTAPALAADWTVDKDKSRLGFTVKQADGEVVGQFDAWSADIDFDPAAPEKAVIKASIETGSVVTGNRQYDDMLQQPDYFSISAFPAATFETTQVIPLGEDAYKAEGTLAIKGVSQPVVLDFTLKIDGDTAKAEGTATVQRLAYGMGTSVATGTLEDTVTVTLDLTATRAQ
ncbi:YceI family protein [Roseibium sp.]|uniref:YceI family protein n=1 Tax=Roseibium sp. TaxID=1936156 RepID=UPI003A97FD63